MDRQPLGCLVRTARYALVRAVGAVNHKRLKAGPGDRLHRPIRLFDTFASNRWYPGRSHMGLLCARMTPSVQESESFLSVIMFLI